MLVHECINTLSDVTTLMEKSEIALNNKFFISDLLHQQGCSVLSDRTSKDKALNLIAHIYSESIEALESFYHNRLSSFDAQVGESSCQIRAYKVLHLSQMDDEYFNRSIVKKALIALNNNNEKLLRYIDNFRQALLEKRGKYDKDLDKPEFMDLFFEKMGVQIELGKNLIFLIQCHILAKYAIRDVDAIPIAIDYKKVCNKLNISYTQTKLLIHKYQKHVAELSCEFVLRSAGQVLRNDSTLLKILPFFCQETEEQRQVIPSYYSTKIILNHAKRFLKPVLLIAKRYIQEKYLDTIRFLFVPNIGDGFLCVNDLTSYKNVNSIVVKGEARYDNLSDVHSFDEYKNKLAAIGIERILLCNMAKHPQYTGNRLKWLTENPFNCINKNDIALTQISPQEIKGLEQELLSDKVCAENYGCHMSNRKLFLARHVYCDRADIHINSRAFLSQKNNVVIQMEEAY